MGCRYSGNDGKNRERDDFDDGLDIDYNQILGLDEKNYCLDNEWTRRVKEKEKNRDDWRVIRDRYKAPKEAIKDTSTGLGCILIGGSCHLFRSYRELSIAKMDCSLERKIKLTNESLPFNTGLIVLGSALMIYGILRGMRNRLKR